jgi:prepilin signal peptidase PulO-like enzyme (type II secretory pathway)
MEIVLLSIFVGLLLCAAWTDLFHGLVIPDWITTPGTVIGLCAVALIPGELREKEVYETTQQLPASSLAELLLTLVVWIVWVVSLCIYTPRSLRNWRRFLRVGVFRSIQCFQAARLDYLVCCGLIAICCSWAGNVVNFNVLATAFWGLGCGLIGLWILRGLAYLGAQQEALGFGDVLLLAMCGAWLSWEFLLPIMVIAIVSTLLISLILVAFGYGKGENAIVVPLGPGISLGGILSVVCIELYPHQAHSIVVTSRSYLGVFGPTEVAITTAVISVAFVLLLRGAILLRR